jgi:hypothetical protein
MNLQIGAHLPWPSKQPMSTAYLFSTTASEQRHSRYAIPVTVRCGTLLGLLFCTRVVTFAWCCSQAELAESANLESAGSNGPSGSIES